MLRTTSREGILFIGCREALVLTAYQDGPHCSIGFGHNDPHLRIGDKIGVPHAFILLRSDVAARELSLDKQLQVDVSQNQFDALVSLHYQSGNRYLPDMLSHINKGDFEAAADFFPQCDRNLAGEESSGLRKRRFLEQAVFVHGEYGPLDPIPYWPDNPRTTRMQQYALQPGDI